MSTFSSDIGPEEEDGGGWGGLLPEKSESERDRVLLGAIHRPAPTIRDAIRLIEKIEKCDGMPAKLILLRNFILFVAGRLSDWP